jgi:hypothetical protein
MSLRHASKAAPIAAALFAMHTAACSVTTTEPPADGGAGTTPTGTSTVPPGPPPAGGPNVIGTGGIAAWDALADKDAVKAFPSLYLHQSVGQDLEDGAEAIGFGFEYYGPSQAPNSVVNGPNGGLFADVGPTDNGKPISKMNVVRREFQKQKGKLKVMTFSFGYADVMDTVEDGGSVSLDRVLGEYKKLVDEVKAAGVRFVHITPPLVFDPSTNAPKMKMRAYMLETFKDDKIFDLTDIESLDGGARCEKGGVWHICQKNRSTAACPSKSQGVDGDGQGHLCATKAAEFSKALLYSIYLAAK